MNQFRTKVDDHWVILEAVNKPDARVSDYAKPIESLDCIYKNIS